MNTYENRVKFIVTQPQPSTPLICSCVPAGIRPAIYMQAGRHNMMLSKRLKYELDILIYAMHDDRTAYFKVKNLSAGNTNVTIVHNF